jgi:hypothetical protein
MIDTAAILLFSLLIIYTVARAIKLDKVLPWFSTDQPTAAPSSDENRRK